MVYASMVGFPRGNATQQIIPYGEDIMFTPRKRARSKKPSSSAKSSRSKSGAKRGTAAKQVNRAGDVLTATAQKKRKRSMPMSTGVMVKKLGKELKKLRPSLATYTYHDAATFQPSASINLAGYSGYDISSPAIIEAALSTIPINTETAPATIASIDFTAVTKNTKYYYQIRSSSIMRNNYLFPVDVRWYHLRPKNGTSTSPINLMDSIDSKQTLPAAAYTAISYYPSDWELFRHEWKIIKSGKQILNSGEELRLYHTKEGSYDMESKDEFTFSYDRKNSELVLLRVQGTVCHDSTVNSTIGFSNVKLDGIVKRSVKIRYPNSAPTRILNYSSNLGGVTTAEMVVDTAEKENAII